jgi:hypothetical protein
LAGSLADLSRRHKLRAGYNFFDILQSGLPESATRLHSREQAQMPRGVTLHNHLSVMVKPDGAAWQEFVRAGRFDERSPEEIVAVCRRLDPMKDEGLLGQLMSHLAVLATRFLAPRISGNLPNGGKDALTNVRSLMVMAILDPAAVDGLGYEMAFYGKLRQRLVDEIRREAKRRQRFEPFAQDEAGEEVEPRDGVSLNSEHQWQNRTRYGHCLGDLKRPDRLIRHSERGRRHYEPRIVGEHLLLQERQPCWVLGRGQCPAPNSPPARRSELATATIPDEWRSRRRE